ncbi:hypothetical protein QQ045_028384 [Rhodiola kirilowii]
MKLKTLEKGKFSASTIQSTINQMIKKSMKEEADDLVAMFFYTSAIPFNCIKNPFFAKMCDAIGKYGICYKPPTYNDIREKLLKRAVLQTDQVVEDFKVEWRRTGCSIMSDGGQIGKTFDLQSYGEENVIQVVTDNAANFKAGGELLMLKRRNLYWTPCVVHCTDLIFEDFEKELILHVNNADEVNKEGNTKKRAT